MCPTVLDASALLAYMRGEPGMEMVREALHHSCRVSSFNVAEVLSKVAERGEDPQATLEDLEGLGWALEIVTPDDDDLAQIAYLRPQTKKLGLSLGDRACIALAKRDDIPLLTADNTWKQLHALVDVRLVR